MHIMHILRKRITRRSAVMYCAFCLQEGMCRIQDRYTGSYMEGDMYEV